MFINHFTFLSKDQIFGNNQLDIIKKLGRKCAITDFAILLGGKASSDYYTNEERAASWWTRISNLYSAINVVTASGEISLSNADNRRIGARPVLYYSSIPSNYKKTEKRKHVILQIEYGEYPQTIVPANFSEILESAYLNSKIKATGKSYTTDSVNYLSIFDTFQARSHIEYEYYEKKYNK